eukprot:2413941-Amphidinium_carterae.1
MEVTPEPPPGLKVPRGTVTDRERAEKQGRFCEEGDLPHPKRTPGRPMVRAEPDEEPGSPRRTGNPDPSQQQKGGGRPVPPLMPTTPLQEALLRTSYAPIEEGGALGHWPTTGCWHATTCTIG